MRTPAVHANVGPAWKDRTAAPHGRSSERGRSLAAVRRRARSDRLLCHLGAGMPARVTTPSGQSTRGASLRTEPPGDPGGSCAPCSCGRRPWFTKPSADCPGPPAPAAAGGAIGRRSVDQPVRHVHGRAGGGSWPGAGNPRRPIPRRLGSPRDRPGEGAGARCDRRPHSSTSRRRVRATRTGLAGNRNRPRPRAPVPDPAVPRRVPSLAVSQGRGPPAATSGCCPPTGPPRLW